MTTVPNGHCRRLCALHVVDCIVHVACMTCAGAFPFKSGAGGGGLCMFLPKTLNTTLHVFLRWLTQWALDTTLCHHAMLDAKLKTMCDANDSCDGWHNTLCVCVILKYTFIRCKPHIEWFDHTYKITMSKRRSKTTEQVQLFLASLVEFYHVLFIVT